MSKIEKVTGTGVPLLLDDIDTDRIIPARYLRCVTFDGLGDHAFEDDRKQDSSHPFDDARFANGGVLVAGRNFGCGSSREHAPQSLIRWGIKAIVAESFAEIFFGNCTALGVPAVTVERTDLEQMANAVQTAPETEITIDLTDCTVLYADKSVACQLPESESSALTSGQWDFLSQLLQTKDKVREVAGTLPYMSNFA